ncbi:MAG: hypothetical protein AB8G14_09550 [Ilumatobacter sp.]
MAAASARSAARSTRSARPERSERRERPELKVVTRQHRRGPALVGGVVIGVVMVAMLGAAVFHTQLAERQLAIDELERQVQIERERFDELRRDRAVLRSPQRIADEARALGMIPGVANRFISVDPGALAAQLAAGGATDGLATSVVDDVDPLDQFRDVKSVSAGQP